jgi:acetaldehyde dehydrogenase / alcohol dehydrogenase
MLGEKVHNKYLDLTKNVVIFRRKKMVDVKKTQTTVTAAKELSADEKMEEAKRYTGELVNKALVAEEAYATYSQEQVDKIVAAMALAGSEASLALAHEAVDETGRGVVEDKDTKNRFATENVYNSIKHEKTVGIIERNQVEGYIKVAAPLGVLAGIVPTTNPTSTTMFKILVALKTRNAIIFSFHPKAQKCSIHAAQILYDAALKAGAPKNIIQWIDKASLENTTALIRNPKIASILATGGPGMVHAALQSGNPSMGVGAGNGAVYIDHTAFLDRAVEDILLSKRFDNSMVCATENSAVVEAPIYDKWLQMMQDKGAYLVPKKDYQKLADFVFNDKHGVNGPVAGMSARWICEHAGVTLPEGKDVLLFELDPKNIGEKLSSEKLSPLLSVYKAKDREDGIRIVKALLDYQGAGHNAAIQIGSQNDPFIDEYGKAVQASRVLVNQPDALGGIGDIYSDGLRPSLTLGTGSWGKNSLSHNLSTSDLLNIKTIAKRRNRPQWIRLPEKIFYEKDSITYLSDENEQEISRAFIVADPGMVKFHFVAKVYEQLALRDKQVDTAIYSEVLPATWFFAAATTDSFQYSNSPLQVSTHNAGYRIDNFNDKKMYYSLGFHPAFNLEGDLADYRLEFDPKQTELTSLLIDPAPFRSGKEEKVTLKDGSLPLSWPLLDKGLKIYKADAASHVKLASGHQHAVTLDISDFPYLAVWSPEEKQAPFVCVEPFRGLPDRYGRPVELSEKDGEQWLFPEMYNQITTTLTFD